MDKEKADLREATSKPLAVAEGIVFVETVFTYEPSRNAFHALDAVAGDEVWSIDDDSGLTSIMVLTKYFTPALWMATSTRWTPGPGIPSGA